MSDNKNNIFVQLYQPLPSTPGDSPTPTTGQPKSPLTPESDPFSAGAPSEYAPILEYVEPHIDESMQPYVQNANPQFVPQPTIPLTPTHTPPVPGIQPVHMGNLPLTEIEIEKEMKTDVYTAIRWLAEWCLRQLQINSKKANGV